MGQHQNNMGHTSRVFLDFISGVVQSSLKTCLVFSYCEKIVEEVCITNIERGPPKNLYLKSTPAWAFSCKKVLCFPSLHEN